VIKEIVLQNPIHMTSCCFKNINQHKNKTIQIQYRLERSYQKT